MEYHVEVSVLVDADDEEQAVLKANKLFEEGMGNLYVQRI